jgi:hypothetical protein
MRKLSGFLIAAAFSLCALYLSLPCIAGVGAALLAQAEPMFMGLRDLLTNV